MLNYLPVKFRGNHYEFIMDTGSITTILPSFMVEARRIMPTNETATTANGGPLSIAGKVRICVRIGNQSAWITALVSE